MATRVNGCMLAAVLLLALAPAGAKQTFGATKTLVFGRFVAGAGGTITVSPAGARSATGGLVLLASTPSPAGFTFTDTAPPRANDACIITLAADNSVVLASDANQMKLSKFTSNPSVTGVMSNGTLQISVGATLVVGANQPKGSYSGSIPVTIQYQ